MTTREKLLIAKFRSMSSRQRESVIMKLLINVITSDEINRLLHRMGDVTQPVNSKHQHFNRG